MVLRGKCRNPVAPGKTWRFLFIHENILSSTWGSIPSDMRSDLNQPAHTCSLIRVIFDVEETLHPWISKICSMKILIRLHLHRLVWIFAGHTSPKVHFFMLRLVCMEPILLGSSAYLGFFFCVQFSTIAKKPHDHLKRNVHIFFYTVLFSQKKRIWHVKPFFLAKYHNNPKYWDRQALAKCIPRSDAASLQFFPLTFEHLNSITQVSVQYFP